MNELTIPAKIDKLNEVNAFVDGVLEEAGCPMKIQMAIDVAVEEIFANIAHYAYRTQETPNGEDPEHPGDATIRIAMEEDAQTVALTFLDSGVPYNPLEKEDPNIALSAEEREIGGLGIFMVKKTMDDVDYEYRDGQNILTIKKHLK